MPSLLNESLNHILKNEASVKDDFFVYLSKFWENLFFHCFIFPKTLTKEAKNCISQIIVEFNLKKKKKPHDGENCNARLGQEMAVQTQFAMYSGAPTRTSFCTFPA